MQKETFKKKPEIFYNVEEDLIIEEHEAFNIKENIIEENKESKQINSTIKSTRKRNRNKSSISVIKYNSNFVLEEINYEPNKRFPSINIEKRNLFEVLLKANEQEAVKNISLKSIKVRTTKGKYLSSVTVKKSRTDELLNNENDNNNNDDIRLSTGFNNNNNNNLKKRNTVLISSTKSPLDALQAAGNLNGKPAKSKNIKSHLSANLKIELPNDLSPIIIKTKLKTTKRLYTQNQELFNANGANLFPVKKQTTVFEPQRLDVNSIKGNNPKNANISDSKNLNDSRKSEVKVASNSNLYKSINNASNNSGIQV